MFLDFIIYTINHGMFWFGFTVAALIFMYVGDRMAGK